MTEFTKVDGKDVGNIKMYALSTCGWCKRTKAYLKDKGVAYSYIDVDQLPDDEIDEVSAQQRGYNPSGSFPTIVVNGDKVIVGYDTVEIDDAIGA